MWGERERGADCYQAMMHYYTILAQLRQHTVIISGEKIEAIVIYFRISECPVLAMCPD